MVMYRNIISLYVRYIDVDIDSMKEKLFIPLKLLLLEVKVREISIFNDQ